MALILLQNDLGTTGVMCNYSWRHVSKWNNMEDISPLFIVAFVSGSSIILAIIYKPSLIENLLGIKCIKWDVSILG